MENNLENKAKFFAQYWGQKIMGNPFFQELGDDREVGSIGGILDAYLNLKVISLATKTDCDRLAEIENDFESKNYRGQMLCQWIDEDYQGKFPVVDFSMKVATEMSDYLRSKGYALPWMGLKVSDLVNYGWVKLKN